jgi:hypothetical protein
MNYLLCQCGLFTRPWRLVCVCLLCLIEGLMIPQTDPCRIRWIVNVVVVLSPSHVSKEEIGTE